MKHFFGVGKKKIFYKEWLPDGEPTGILQIIHGMAEHSESYSELAEFFADSGIAVFAHDQRGHGKTAVTDEEYGCWEPEVEWENVMTDIHQFTSIIQKKYPEVPYFILGHSMGSFLARDYAARWGDIIDGVIISATDGSQGLATAIGFLIAKHECRKYGYSHHSQRLSDMSFKSYNNKFKPNRTGCDWLTRDTQKVDEYIADKRCGGVFSSGFYYELLKNIKPLSSPKSIRHIPSGLPFLFLTGEADPLSNNGRRVWDLINKFERCGVFYIEAVFYAECRHDLKLELNREMIFNDTITWIKEKISEWQEKTTS